MYKYRRNKIQNIRFSLKKISKEKIDLWIFKIEGVQVH